MQGGKNNSGLFVLRSTVSWLGGDVAFRSAIRYPLKTIQVLQQLHDAPSASLNVVGALRGAVAKVGWSGLFQGYVARLFLHLPRKLMRLVVRSHVSEAAERVGSSWWGNGDSLRRIAKGIVSDWGFLFLYHPFSRALQYLRTGKASSFGAAIASVLTSGAVYRGVVLSCIASMMCRLMSTWLHYRADQYEEKYGEMSKKNIAIRNAVIRIVSELVSYPFDTLAQRTMAGQYSSSSEALSALWARSASNLMAGRGVDIVRSIISRRLLPKIITAALGGKSYGEPREPKLWYERV